MEALRRGDLIDQFEVTTVDGSRFTYASVWQHKNLVLIALPDRDCVTGRSYESAVHDRMAEFNARNTACVVTREPVPGLPRPGALVADRWGEILFVRSPADLAGLPSVAELADWIDYAEIRCPECEGEAK